MVDVVASSFRVVFDARTSMTFVLKLSRVHVDVAGNDVRVIGVGVPPIIFRAKSVWISTRFECALFELETNARTSARRRYPYIFVGGGGGPSRRLYPFTTPNAITEMSYPPAAPRLRFALCTDGANVYRMNHDATHTLLPLHSRMAGMSLREIHHILSRDGKIVHAPSETILRRNVRLVVA